MSSHYMTKFLGVSDYEFSRLPKGDMFCICMNPYNGNVYIHLAKQEATNEITLQLLKGIVTGCKLFEDCSSPDPLGDFLDCCEAGEFMDMLVCAAKREYRAIEGRKEPERESVAAVS